MSTKKTTPSHHSAALGLLRAKVSQALNSEPPLVQQEVMSHKAYFDRLANSGATAEAVQKAWHAYYQGLSADEKQRVWQEYYETEGRAPTTSAASMSAELGAMNGAIDSPRP